YSRYRMGGAVSAFGVNQPFILALIGIIMMLGMTVYLVGGDSPDDDVYLEVVAHDQNPEQRATIIAANADRAKKDALTTRHRL
ncbi:hypothetical protein PRIPAC_76413, partial [Pristionchus pacificus]|uniref:Uncharacterized protein n=1 Tax=Pristionchus pacificus TaxID=54126 RepID=A0A2A6BG46_PRIPA